MIGTTNASVQGISAGDIRTMMSPSGNEQRPVYVDNDSIVRSCAFGMDYDEDTDTVYFVKYAD